MPSLAQGYGRGLLLSLDIMERQRRLKQDELLDEYRREQLADIRWGREKEKKSLLAQIKAEEETAKRQEMVADIAAIGAGGLRTAPQFMRSILAGEETPPETKERLTSIMDYVPGLSSEEQFKRIRVGEKVEGAPGARPWYEQYLGGEEMRGAAKVAGGLEPKAEKPKLPVDWLKAPEKKEAAIQKWVTDWEEYIFTPTGEEDRLIREVQAIRSQPENEWTEEQKVKVKTLRELGGFESLSETEKQTHFRKWAKRIPAHLRRIVRERVGMDVSTPSPPEEKPKYTQEQMDSYNVCRDRGRTKEECKVEAGF